MGRYKVTGPKLPELNKMHMKKTNVVSNEFTPTHHWRSTKAIIDTVLYDACLKCSKSVRDNFCTKCSATVSPSKMPRCEVLVNQDDQYNSVVLFYTQLSQMIPGPMSASQEDLTTKIVSDLPQQISFTWSHKKKINRHQHQSPSACSNRSSKKHRQWQNVLLDGEIQYLFLLSKTLYRISRPYFSPLFYSMLFFVSRFLLHTCMNIFFKSYEFTLADHDCKALNVKRPFIKDISRLKVAPNNEAYQYGHRKEWDYAGSLL